ncbi:pantoate--beta-alanine ligase [Bacillus sp. DTU_2020_1000418_1_SI_GHA_SEK_038]|uniref:pantoate--beta-alanine ligase n=1 Tax=Bacillus sp. DTU_2020_1000418_1_SI_GHA_SEK_038 TaxID=3077585 RepID=UPI0028EAB87C|nr:pantoate--beta-alanine ligase [Bacillus sp. DTU_2020_1000418_1_SI_GHA_SEK_038]WNS74006.1 pantoate--beta-alanine ligase [Bacillus sp. DTU_2020_1000418_1_SI_GHA_SEK_038]
MKVITSISDMQQIMLQEKMSGKSIGYVPTMGYLHEGHLTLIDHARQENDLVVLSIFVNPLQFGPSEDLSSYPRDFDRDSTLAEKHQVDYIFNPSPEEMYPAPLSVTVIAKDRTDVLCGQSRPGHFDGVVTVLTKLFNIVQPNKAYFGKKDAQQLAVVEGLVNDFHFPIKIVPVDIVREHDGLAKSSRNVYLLPEEREQAPILYKSLLKAKAMIEEGERNSQLIISSMKEMISEKTSGTIDYIEIYSYPDLKEIERIEGNIIIALAVKFSKARLIDNLILAI